MIELKDKKIYIVIPAHNEGSVLANLLNKIKSVITAEIIVVNDGSTDNTTEIALENKAIVLEHMINRGAGAATKTGIKYALQEDADIIITMDGDGQHDPSDIPNVLDPVLKEEFDVAIGSRLLNRENMPVIRRFFNLAGNIFTYLLFGLMIKDSQSGFKAFSKSAVNKINFNADGYEFCSEIIREIKKNKLKYIEIPIKTIYTDYSLSKGQNFSKGISIIFRLFFGK